MAAALSFDALKALATDTGFPNPELAAAVAMAESGGDPERKNIVTVPAPGNLPERSFGLWQVNTLAHPSYDEALLLDAVYNAQAALAVSKQGTDWSPWSTYTSGRYLAWMGGGVPNLPPPPSPGPSSSSSSSSATGWLVLAGLWWWSSRKGRSWTL